MWNKIAMNPDHEFALIVLTKGAEWVCWCMCSAIHRVEDRAEVYVKLQCTCRGSVSLIWNYSALNGYVSITKL